MGSKPSRFSSIAIEVRSFLRARIEALVTKTWHQKENEHADRRAENGKAEGGRVSTYGLMQQS
jgi:hypothetical protein